MIQISISLLLPGQAAALTVIGGTRGASSMDIVKRGNQGL